MAVTTKASRRTRKPSSKTTKGGFKLSKNEVVYDKVSVKICREDKALTADDAKKILGWTEEPEGKSWGNDYLLKDVQGRKIVCVNNTTNRPLQDGLVSLYKQEHLRKRWRF